MLRTKCIWCGKTVRGGDDWAGRSGHCPNCDAEILFPRIGPPPTEPAPAKPFTFIDPDDFLNATGWGAVGLAALCGVSAWIWARLIIFLAYGFMPYRMGLRVGPIGKEYGVCLNNGARLDLFWTLVFASGFLTSWFLLMRGGNYLVDRTRPRSWAITLIVLAGCAAWFDLLYHAIPDRHLFPVHFGAGPAREGFLTLIVVFATAGMVVWRDWKAERETLDIGERPTGEDASKQ